MALNYDPGYTNAQWERYCQLAAAIIIGYEFVFNIDKEVQLFWKSRWSFSKVLFLWSRYYSLAFNIGNASVFMQERATIDLCFGFFHWQNAGATLQYITTQIILELRLYAMYNRSKKILAFLVFLTAAEIAAMGTLFGVPRLDLIGTNEPVPGFFICADADPANVHWMAWVPATILITETILLSLALWKSFQHYKAGTGGHILPWLVKQNVWYFAVIFLVHLANLCIWMINTLTLNELLTGFSFAIPAAIANRLLIAVRQRGQEPSHVVTDQSHLRWGVATAGRNTTHDVELASVHHPTVHVSGWR